MRKFLLFPILVLLYSCGTESTPTYTLSTSVVGEGAITPSGGTYEEGETVTLTGNPSNGWSFLRWEGDWSSAGSPISIIMNRNYNVIGVFEYKPVFLSENGSTIMCPYGKVGEVGIVDGVEYEVVDRDLLIRRRDRGRDLSKVCVSLVKDMSSIFAGTFDKPTQYDPNIRNWDVSNVTEMYQMFYFSQFNQPIGEWDVSNVTDMGFMFWGSPFNQPIGEWDLSSVNDLEGMFGLSPFNQPIENWDVSNVVTLRAMFRSSPFNQPIGEWDVSNVNNMRSMFSRSQFNQPIGEWDVSNVTDMGGMFRALSSNPTPFNQPIGGWNVSNVTDMNFMFFSSEFNKNISGWCVSRIETEPSNFSWHLTPENKPKWGTCPD